MPIRTGPEDFWRFFALREEARRNKEAGAGPPYSKDPILARYHFCNVFREADAGTRYFQQFRARRRYVDQKALVNAVRETRRLFEDVLWQACLYRPINRVSTFEAFRKEASLLRSPFVEVGYSAGWLHWLKARFGKERVFTGRHLNRGLDYYALMLRFLEGRDALGLRTIAAKILEGERGLKPVVKALTIIPGIGAFFGWQIACDLVESGVVADDPGWAQLGPGATRGARLINPTPGARPLDTAKWLVETQERFAETDWPSARRAKSDWYRYPVTLKDVEHALCEYVRYVNAREGRPSLEVKPWARK